VCAFLHLRWAGGFWRGNPAFTGREKAGFIPVFRVVTAEGNAGRWGRGRKEGGETRDGFKGGAGRNGEKKVAGEAGEAKEIGRGKGGSDS